MTPGRRISDLLLAGLLLIPALPVMLALALWVRVRDGAPVFFGSERMAAPDRSFQLWKFRTMHPEASQSGVTGGDKGAAITPTGRWLRASRLDELPQLWNVLRGDMGFVGPRPPLRLYTERFPELYARVLRSRPGITGLATLRFRRKEAELLSACTTPEETDRVYAEHCIPVKARLDLLYEARRTACSDLILMGRTVASLMKR